MMRLGFFGCGSGRDWEVRGAGGVEWPLGWTWKVRGRSGALPCSPVHLWQCHIGTGLKELL